MPKQILLVEDSVTMQKVVQIAFAREDYQIRSATSADEALGRLREGRPDIVVADAGLTGKSGYDLAAAVKADPATKDVPVLLLTGNFNPYDEARGQRSGVDAFLVKPFDTQSVVEKVNGLLRGRRRASPGVQVPRGDAGAAAAVRGKPDCPGCRQLGSGHRTACGRRSATLDPYGDADRAAAWHTKPAAADADPGQRQDQRARQQPVYRPRGEHARSGRPSS
jgi:DNA-binding response OmpR family regulator